MLAQKLKILMENEELRNQFSKKSTKDLDRFNTDNIINEWVGLIESI